MQDAVHRHLLTLLNQFLIAALCTGLCRGGQENLDRRIRQDDRADVAAVHQDIAVFRHIALGFQQKPAYFRHSGYLGRVVRNLRCTNGFGDILAVQENALCAVLIGQLNGDLRQGCDNACRVLSGNAPAAHRQTDGTVHRTRIHIYIAEFCRGSTRHGGFSCPGRAVDGNRNVLHHDSSSAADRPAKRPVDHAICRLKPPV